MAVKPKTGAGASDATVDVATDYDVAGLEPSSANLPAPRMGQLITVVAGPGRHVVNREFGGVYSETDATPATVNLRILRLLDDEDLIRQADAQ
ncbi:hypothetical protein BLA13014_04432 [Burkholderia aenigmatica]|uniref:Uncharacterized protein n=1 Tax=Burkholderia aenigmatica TaxID=2015348 RepID=A0A6P2NK54_9BURK|nr:MULTISPECIES: hypothetical protein [Burkholderia]VWB94984.1 hypothetical protein BLA13014_04432 [Burkholderia aenigmatica]